MFTVSSELTEHLLRRLLLLTFFTAVSWGALSVDLNAQDRCADVLSGGVFKNYWQKDNEYSRQILAATLTKKTKQEADKSYGGGITVPIDGIPIGGNYSQQEYDNFQEQVKKTLDVDQILSHQNEILISSGDKDILAAWTECIKRNGGILMTFRERGGNDLNLEVTYYRYPGGATSVTISHVGLDGADFKPGEAKLLAEGVRLQDKNTQYISLKRTNLHSAANININVLNFTGATAYLPAKATLPAINKSAGNRAVLAESYFNDSYGRRYWYFAGPVDTDPGGWIPTNDFYCAYTTRQPDTTELVEYTASGGRQALLPPGIYSGWTRQNYSIFVPTKPGPDRVQAWLHWANSGKTLRFAFFRQKQQNNGWNYSQLPDVPQYPPALYFLKCSNEDIASLRK